jgi:hypothetical protein
MSGMQDVALLSERYSLLFSTSQKLQRNVDRLKKEVIYMNIIEILISIYT